MHFVQGYFVDDGEDVYFDEGDGDILPGIEEEFGGHEGVELHEGDLFFIVEDLEDVDDRLVDEGPGCDGRYISFFLNCRTKGFSFYLISIDIRIS